MVDMRDPARIADAMERLGTDEALLADLRWQAMRRKIDTWDDYALALADHLGATAQVTARAAAASSTRLSEYFGHAQRRREAFAARSRIVTELFSQPLAYAPTPDHPLPALAHVAAEDAGDLEPISAPPASIALRVVRTP